MRISTYCRFGFPAAPDMTSSITAMWKRARAGAASSRTSRTVDVPASLDMTAPLSGRGVNRVSAASVQWDTIAAGSPDGRSEGRLVATELHQRGARRPELGRLPAVVGLLRRRNVPEPLEVPARDALEPPVR